jgi:hypothetical protein
MHKRMNKSNVHEQCEHGAQFLSDAIQMEKTCHTV